MTEPMHNIFSTNQWTDCLADSQGKRPRISPAMPAKGLDYDSALLRAHNSKVSPNYGFLFSKDDLFIGIDVDVDPSGQKQNTTLTIPPALLFFLKSYPTHVHYSPGTHGLHLIYQVTKATQEQLSTLNKKQNAVSIDDGALFNGDWRWDRSFLTFTENLHESSQDISMIDFSTLETLLGPLAVPSTTTYDTSSAVFDISSGLKLHPHIPSLTELAKVLEDIPSTFNYLAKQACSKLQHSQPTTNYEYWLLVGQACAHTAIYFNTFEQIDEESIEGLFVAWSSKDPEFVSIEDAQKKFQSLLRSTHKHMQNNEPTASYKVLVSLAKGACINFPVLRGKELLPDPTSVRNYDYLIEYDQLSLCRDTMADGYTWEGPEEVINKWFCPKKDYTLPRKAGFSQVMDQSLLKVVFLPYMQDRFKQSVLPMSASTAVNHYCAETRTVNAFKAWVDSEPWDGQPRFDSVCHSITYSDNQSNLYDSYIRKSLLAMIGIHYYSEDHPKIPAMLVLKGPQYTYKSSWAEWLLPPELMSFLGMASVETIVAASVERDRLLSTRAIVVVNECEPLFSPKHEQKVKSSVDQEVVTYRDLYEKSVISRQRTALIIGTTNKSNLFTGSMGTRKIWQIPVKQCDSRLILDMDKQQLYAEIKHILMKMKEENPKMLIQDAWAMAAEERDTIDESNRRSKGTMGVEALLVEMFGDPVDTPFDMENYTKIRKGTRDRIVQFRQGNAYDVSNLPNSWQVTQLLRFMKDQFPDDSIDRKSLVYALNSYCELFTDTKGCIKHPFRKINTERSWPVDRGTVSYSTKGKLYLLPVIGGELQESEEKEVE